MYYCVFWVPCVFQSELTKRITDSCAVARVDDNVTHIPYNVKITFPNSGRYDILLTSQGSSVAPLELHECQTGRNGLIKYCFETRGLSDKDIEFWEKALKHPIYHVFKNFFHEHVFHAPDSDALLAAYITKHNVDIFAVNNKALCHYLNSFEQSFIGFSNQILERRNHLRATLLQQEYGVYSFILKKYKQIEDLCNTALGEKLYYDILLASWEQGPYKNAGTQRRNNGQNAIRTIMHLRDENHKTFIRLSNSISMDKMQSFTGLVYQTKDLIKGIKDKTLQLETATAMSKKQGNISLIVSAVSLLIGIIGLVISFISLHIARG